jgi:cGMP-dependent protein kinase
LESRTFASGEKIVTEGEVGDAMYIIREGKVDIFKASKKVRSIGQDNFFGERSVLLDEVRSATVVANGEV